MSLLGLGTDVVSVARVAAVWRRHGPRFLQRCFRNDEVKAILGAGAGEGAATERALAVRWAAKEACLKALGGDVSTIPYRDLEVETRPGGGVGLRLHGRAAGRLKACGGSRLHLSISRARETAVAMVAIED